MRIGRKNSVFSSKVAFCHTHTLKIFAGWLLSWNSKKCPLQLTSVLITLIGFIRVTFLLSLFPHCSFCLREWVLSCYENSRRRRPRVVSHLSHFHVLSFVFLSSSWKLWFPTVIFKPSLKHTKHMEKGLVFEETLMPGRWGINTKLRINKSNTSVK